MKKHELVKVIEQHVWGRNTHTVTNADGSVQRWVLAVKLDEDEGTYYVEAPNHDIVALTKREVEDGRERFVDVWVIYPRSSDNIRESTYSEKFNSIDEAICSVLAHY